MKKLLKSAVALLCCGCTVLGGSGCFLLEFALDQLLYHEHVYGESDDPSVLRACTYEGCTAGIMPETERAYQKEIVYTFNDADKERIDEQRQALLDELETTESYDANKHAYDERSRLYQQYLSFEEKWNAYVESLDHVYTQYQYAYLLCDVDTSDEQAEADYQEIADYNTAVTAEYNALFQPIYDSAYREYFYAGWTEEEIETHLSESEKMSDEEYTRLETRNTELYLEYFELDVETSDKLLTLYEEFVDNNNALARLLGYQNYLEYAYDSIYAREYGYKDINAVASYVKTYLTPAYRKLSNQLETRFNSASLTDAEIEEYNGVFFGSFFDNVTVNGSVNAYFERLERPEGFQKPISFSKTLDEACEKGAYLLGDYSGAYTWYITELSSPFLFFGEEYRDAFTFVHEFGHYFYDVYSEGNYCSTDLSETHSQGNEMLFLSFLEEYFSPASYELVRLSQLQYALNIILLSMTVNVFEEAVYTGAYSGKNAATILSDGKISKNEYDLLYESILEDFGLAEEGASTYWRYVTVEQPGYYVSYSVSMACSLQLYIQAETQSLDTAIDRYLKLITHTDTNENMTYKEALQYAGLKTYDDETLYKEIAEYFNPSTSNGGLLM